MPTTVSDFILLVIVAAVLVSHGTMIFYWFAFTINSSRNGAIDKNQERRTRTIFIISALISGVSIGLVTGYDRGFQNFPFLSLICAPFMMLLALVVFRQGVNQLRVRLEE